MLGLSRAHDRSPAADHHVDRVVAAVKRPSSRRSTAATPRSTPCPTPLFVILRKGAWAEERGPRAAAVAGSAATV